MSADSRWGRPPNPRSRLDDRRPTIDEVIARARAATEGIQALPRLGRASPRRHARGPAPRGRRLTRSAGARCRSPRWRPPRRSRSPGSPRRPWTRPAGHSRPPARPWRGPHDAPAGDGDRSPGLVGHVRLAGEGVRHAGRRTHDPPGPRRVCGQAGLCFFAERYQGDLLAEISPATRDRTQHRLVPEHGLDAHGRPATRSLTTASPHRASWWPVARTTWSGTSRSTAMPPSDVSVSPAAPRQPSSCQRTRPAGRPRTVARRAATACGFPGRPPRWLGPGRGPGQPAGR